MALTLTGATAEVTHDGTSVVANGPIYKNERDIDLKFDLDSQDVNPTSNTFAQSDTYFATTNRKCNFSLTTVLGKLSDNGTIITDGVFDFLKFSNLTAAEGTPVASKKVFELTPNSTREGKGEVTIKTVDRTIVVEKVIGVISISLSRGGETELKIDCSGYVKSDTDGQSNTLADPVKPVASVLTTTDGVNTGVTVNGFQVDPQSVEFGMNTQTKMPPAMKSANVMNIADDADHQISISAYLSSANFEEGYDSIVAGDQIAIGIDFEDTADVAIWNLSVPKAKVINTPNREDSDGVYAITKQYRCRPTNGNDNFTLTYFSDIPAV